VAEYPRPSTEGRAANMRAIRRTDTKPEVALRRALHRQGYRFRKDYRLDLADGKRVRPDIAFTARRVAVFVDGCFWHACPEHGGRPANNVWSGNPNCAGTWSGTAPRTPPCRLRAGMWSGSGSTSHSMRR
jgi:DNA mismatch endonuclease (patch repair protein)